MLVQYYRTQYVYRNFRSSHRDSFRKYLFFFSRSNLFIVFQEGLSKRHVFSRRFYLFVEQTFLSHRTDTNFPQNPYLVLEHIRIFQEPLFCHRTHTIFQETLSSPRTHTIFQETPMPRTHRHFPGKYPLSNRYFVNRSRWLLSKTFFKEVLLHNDECLFNVVENIIPQKSSMPRCAAIYTNLIFL